MATTIHASGSPQQMRKMLQMNDLDNRTVSERGGRYCGGACGSSCEGILTTAGDLSLGCILITRGFDPVGRTLREKIVPRTVSFAGQVMRRSPNFSVPSLTFRCLPFLQYFQEKDYASNRNQK